MDKKWYQRPWYEWIGWLVWLVVTILFLQTAIASKVELAGQAALLSWIIFAILIVIAAVVWGMRIARSNQKS